VENRGSPRLLVGLVVVVLIVGCNGTPPSAVSPTALASSSAVVSSTPATQASPSVAASSATMPMVQLQGRIVFARAGERYGDETIFMANADGSDERQMTDLGKSCCGRVSPAGTQILYSISSDDGRITTAIENLDNGIVRSIPLPDATANLGPGAWAPDGKRLALQLWDDTDPSRDGVYTVRASDGADLVRLTDPGVADIPGGYAPDGAQLVVFRESNVQSVGELLLVNVDGSRDLRRISPDGVPVGFGSVRYAPDGSVILFQEARTSSTGALYTIRPDGTNLRKVFEDVDGKFASHPTWSPDGSMIMFALSPVANDFEHRPNGLYVIGADDTELRLVVGGRDFKREPEWFE